MHEVGHALGLWHEQQRPDRDAFIKVLHQNLRYNSGPLFAQYVKRPVAGDVSVPYDINSLMHYGPKVRELHLCFTVNHITHLREILFTGLKYLLNIGLP